MRLTDRKTIQDWKKLKPLLVQSDDQLLWRKVYIDYFIARVNSRYLEPIKSLRERDSYLGYGFTIVTVLCSLVEFLESTRKGQRYKYCKDRDLGLNEYNKSRECFIDFLTTQLPFKDQFSQDIAKDFYSSVRCGLLHEASTKGGWRIWGKSDTGKDIICYKTKKLFRDDFEWAIREYITAYGDSLAESRELQEAFIRKFDWLCE